MKKTDKFKPKSKGALLLGVLVMGAAGILVLGGLVSWGVSNLKLTRQTVNREMALQIAEAGVEYYRWHLSEAPDDFTDGTGEAGPYEHNFFDRTGNLIGKYYLEIEPSTTTGIIIVRSRGETLTVPLVSRTIEVKLVKPSLVKYAFLANSLIRFGQGTEVFGPIHSNNGVRLDGLAHNLVTSALEQYQDPDHEEGEEFAVHTHINPPPPPDNYVSSFRPDEAPPSLVASRPDIFMAGRQFPVPAIDFAGLTSSLIELKTLAEGNGRYFSPSGAFGYNIILKTDDSFDLYKVDSLLPPPQKKCAKVNWDGQEGWGTWSVGTQTFLGNYPFPENGIIFTEDHVWVEGAIDGAHLSIAAGRFPENPDTNANINFDRDIVYTNRDGSDSIGLIAQGNVNVGMASNDILRVDAALIAKNGRVGRYFYTTNCAPWNVRESIYLYGMVVTNSRYGFAYADNDEGGYANRYLEYDKNLVLNPPPFFPLIGDIYEIASWKETE